MSQIAAAKIGARIDRLPSAPAVWRLVLLISFGGLFEFYDVFLTSYVVPAMSRSGMFTAPSIGVFAELRVISLIASGSFVFALFVGLWVGALFVAPVADRLGRRSVFLGSIVWYLVCTAVMALQHSGEMLDLWRFLAGIGFGIELVTMDVYLAELVPARLRGRAFAVNQSITFAVVPVVALLAWFLGPTQVGGLDGWRIVILLGSVGLLVVVWLACALPESPRWLALHGRAGDAEQIVSALEAAVSAVHGPLAAPEPARPERAASGSFLELLSPRYVERSLMFSIFNIFQVIGFYGFAAWVPTLLIARGVTFAHSLEYAVLIALANPVGPLLVIPFADRVERRVLILFALVLMAVFMTGFALASRPAAVIAFGVLFTIAANVMSSTFHAYQAELFPTRMRARAIGFVYSWSRISAAFSGLTVGFFLHYGGVAAIAVVISLALAIAAIIIGAFGPRTLGRPLETVSH